MILWSLVDTVFLDMDGTLLDLRFDNHFWLEHVPARYAEKHGISREDALEHHLMPRYSRMAGRLEWYCIDYWTCELGLDIAGLKEEVTHLIAVHPHVEAFLACMRREEKRTILLTNAHRKSLGLKMRHTGLEGWFDAIITAHDIGLPKENPDFWERLQEKERFRPEYTLLIDDSLPVLASADDYGIAHLFCIKKPDSTLPERSIPRFPAIRSFSEILPPPCAA